MTMIVDLIEKEESGTFELEGGGKVHLRLLSLADLKEIRAACFTSTPEYPLLNGKYQRFEVDKFNADLFSEMSIDRNIAGWDDIFDRNQVPIPVTKENKVLLMSFVPAFKKAVEEGNKAIKDAEKTTLSRPAAGLC